VFFEVSLTVAPLFGGRSLELEHAVDGVLGSDGEQSVLEADVRVHEGRSFAVDRRIDGAGVS
jgi:hypothetical protein